MRKSDIHPIDGFEIEGDVSGSIEKPAVIVLDDMWKSNVSSESYNIKVLYEDKNEELYVRTSKICIIRDKYDNEWALWGDGYAYVLFSIPSRKDRYLAMFDIQTWLYDVWIHEEKLNCLEDSFTSEDGREYNVLDWHLYAVAFYAKYANVCMRDVQYIISHYYEEEKTSEEKNPFLSKGEFLWNMEYYGLKISNDYADFYKDIYDRFSLKDRIPEDTVPVISDFSEIFKYGKNKKLRIENRQLISYNSKGYVKDTEMCVIQYSGNSCDYLLIPDTGKAMTYNIFRATGAIIKTILFSVPYKFENVDDCKETPFFIGTITANSIIELVQEFLNIMDPEKRKKDEVLFDIEALRYAVITLLDVHIR